MSISSINSSVQNQQTNLTIHKFREMSVDSVDFVSGTFNNAELSRVALSRFKQRLRVHAAEPRPVRRRTGHGQ